MARKPTKPVEPSGEPAAAAAPPPPVNPNAPITDLIRQLGAENVQIIARMMSDTERIRVRELLAEPFPTASVRWKPQSVKNNRCMAIAYIDARLVMDRLDDVMGVDGWRDEYVLMPDGSAMCCLSLLFGGQWVTKCDTGSQSDQPDAGDRLKSAFSDALKRAAVKFGVGRYLYRVPNVWVDYDPVKKRIPSPPPLPPFAVPKRTGDAKTYHDGEWEEETASAAPKADPPKAEPVKAEPAKPSPLPDRPDPDANDPGHEVMNPLIPSSWDQAFDKMVPWQREMVNHHADHVAGCMETVESVSDLNAELKNGWLADVHQSLKAMVFGVLKALALKKNWGYDAHSKCFYDKSLI